MPETAKSFDDLMSLTFAEGALSVQAKELIALGISVAVRCEPCMNYHIEQARTKGASDEKLLEAMTVGFEMGVGQLIPPLRKVLRSQFASGGEGRTGVGAGPVQARSRAARTEPDEDVQAESCHRMWTLY
jgi:AhpD family alkylhydroperoxidase